MANHKGRNAAGKTQVVYGREKNGPRLTSIQCVFLSNWPVCLLAIIVDAVNI